MKKKRWVIVATIIIVLAALIAIVFKYYITNERYNVALSMEKEKDVLSAVDTYVEIIDFKDSRERVEKLSKYLFDDNYHIQFGLTARINDEENGTVTWEYALYDEKNTLYEQAKSRISDVAFICRGDDVFFALLYGGQVIHTDFNDEPSVTNEFYKDEEKEFLESEWQGIQKIYNSIGHLVGLRSDGTVVAAGDNDCGQCNVGNWKEIIDVAAGNYFTVGLKEDGTVVLAAKETRESFDFESSSMETINILDEFKDMFTWREIKKISGSFKHVVGLKEDGTVVAVGQNEYGQLNVGDWKDVVDVFATEMATIGLRNDGYVYITER